MGPLTYDLVPLLVERRLEPVDEALIRRYQESFLEARAKEKLGPVDAAELRYEFNLMTVQRQLKATGTFSYQTFVVGRAEYYEKYIKPSVATVLRALVEPGMKEYPTLRGALEGICKLKGFGDFDIARGTGLPVPDGAQTAHVESRGSRRPRSQVVRSRNAYGADRDIQHRETAW